MRIHFRRSFLSFLVLSALLAILDSESLAQGGPDALREAFLQDDAGVDAFLALLLDSEVLRDRRVQAKLLRSLRDSDLEIFQAAAGVVMLTPQIDFVAPRLWRRLETVFLGEDQERKLALLELARERPEYRQDLRIVGLVAEAILEDGTPLGRAALSLAREDSSIAANPAVVEAMAAAQGGEPAFPLPDWNVFQAQIAPILTTPGGDATACVECHKNRTIMHLRPPEEVADDAERTRQYYRSLLRVVDLKQPERSLLLVKPTRPAPKTQPAPASLETHTGGARFHEGDETYQKILAWIRSH